MHFSDDTGSCIYVVVCFILSKIIMILMYTLLKYVYMMNISYKPCRVGSVGSVSASRTVGREFVSRPGHTKDHHKNGTNCLSA